MNTVSKLLLLITIAITGIISVNSLSKNPDIRSTGLVQGQKTESVGTSTGNSNKPLQNSINKLQETEKTVKNKEIKGQVEQIIEDTEEAETEIVTSIATIEARPKYVKFIMGPDYKNAGAVRSEMVQIRNQISKLERMEGKPEASTSTKNITESAETLKQELASLETRLYENLQGFSLFGWLNKLLTGFVPIASPTPTTTSEASPSGSPVATVEPTMEPTVEPTLTPTSTP